jgi:signal transduction histidine kinase/phage shock protein PspC (stress-responsive transcriptional regulator)
MSTMPLAFARRREGRILTGVAGGFADQHGINVVVVRAALVILTFAGGLGIILYAIGFVVSEPRSQPLPPPAPADHQRDLSVAAITLGLVLIMRAIGVWLGDAFMVTLIAVVSGFAVLGVLRPGNPVTSWPGSSTSPMAEMVVGVSGRHGRARIVAGAGLIAAGLLLVGIRPDVSRGVRIGVFATALTIVGVALLLGPWMAKAAQQVAEERRQRIRSEERERMAAHLHDSVLQTLALIQRSADDPRRTVTLARRQEHELREWLYGPGASANGTLSAAVQATAGEVEELYDVRIEVVVVGDQPMDERTTALIGAIREACVNAAKHSGADSVAVYVEVGGDDVDAYVRDRGRGFDPEAATADRKGIVLSIEARVQRVGGTASIASEPGHGTEVHLTVPVHPDVEGTVRA